MFHNKLSAIFSEKIEQRARYAVYFLSWVIILSALFSVSRLNYLLFHGLAELFSIIIACAIFTIAWNSRHFTSNSYIIIIGVSALFVAGIDLIHILAFKGMGVFPGIQTNTATQLWIAARYLQSISLLTAAIWLLKKDKRTPNANLLFFVYFVVTVFIFLSIFYWRIFPPAYINGLGLTPFKKISEYLISAILLLSLFPLAKRDYEFDQPVFRLIVWSTLSMVLAEISFTFYIDPYGIFNTIGHLLKIISFYLLYRAVVVANFKNPFAFLFKNIKQKETALTAALKESQRASESLKINEQLYRDALIYTQNIIDTVRQPLLVLDEHLKIDSANRSFYAFFKAAPDEIEKKFLPKICDCEWDNPELIGLIQKSFVIDQNFSNFEIAIHCQKIGQKTLLFSGKKIKRPGNRPPLALLSIDDITERKQAEQKITHLASFPEYNPNPIIELNLNGQIIFTNPATARILNKLGIKNAGEAFLPDDITAIVASFNKKTDEKPAYREIQIKNLTFAENIHLIKNLNVIRVYAADITERKIAEVALHETKDYLDKLVNHANAPIVIWNPRHEIVRFNYAFEQLTGREASEIVGHQLIVLFPEADQKKSLEKIIAAAEGGQRHPVEIPILRQNGSVRILLWSSANIYNDYYDKNKKTLIATIAQGQDITELKEIDQAKTEFISLTAHQLRTPLATIGLTAEMLLRGLGENNNEETKHYLKSINSDIKNMAEMIETFLNVSRIEMGTFPINAEPADLIETIDNIVDDIMPQIINKQLNLEKKYRLKMLPVNLDNKAMRVVLDNLLSNAIKYTPQGGRIIIEIAKPEKEIIIKISDTGCGIPTDQQSKVFDKMYRASNIRNTQAEGVGLGLYMVKSVLEQASCRIWLESEEHKGTTFYLAIPLSGMTKKQKNN